LNNSQTEIVSVYATGEGKGEKAKRGMGGKRERERRRGVKGIF